MGGHQGAEFPCRQSEITRRPSDRSVRPLFVEGGWGFFTDQVAIAFAYATPLVLEPAKRFCLKLLCAFLQSPIRERIWAQEILRG